MKKGIRRICLGMAVSLYCTNTVFAMEYVPPNPLSSGIYTETTEAGQPPSSANTGTEHAGNTAVPGNGSAVVVGTSPSGEANGALGNNGALGTDGALGNNGALGNYGTETESTAPSDNAAPSALEGTVFAGSAQVAAPSVAAEGAVLINCGTGQILFEKNARTPFYPASITKIMTALLTVENCSLNDVVTFSKAATTNLESGAVTISLTEGDQLTVKDSLYALLLKSANEVANGLAEHMGGSVENFANMMNVRAAQLGCTGTHFANPNGLNNASHLTTPYDMALIARAAYANPVISQISTTTAYQMPATKQSGAKTITMGHKMLYPTDSRYYPGMVGGKTGYTSKAGNTLVTCVEQNGVRLIAVVMKASGTHYTDTKAMLDYGFALAASGEIQGK